MFAYVGGLVKMGVISVVNIRQRWEWNCLIYPRKNLIFQAKQKIIELVGQMKQYSSKYFVSLVCENLHENY